MAKGLSKSRIISGLQCPKRAFLDINRRDLLNNDFNQAAFAIGHELGELARTLHPDGVLIEDDHNLKAAIAKTHDYLAKEGDTTLFEATFSHDGVLVRADILQRECGRHNLSEVKASTSVKDYHVSDCAIQAWVIEKAGYKIDSVNLAHVNTSFVYQGGGQYDGLLTYEDITEDVRGLMGEVEGWISNLREVLEGDEPVITVGSHCRSPFSCPYMDYCKPPESEYPVTALPGKGKIVDVLLNEGINDIRDIPEGRLSNPTQERVRRITVDGHEEINAQASEVFINLPFPRYYLDFETIGSVIPRWAGTRPYEGLPFQWSCHIENEDGSLSHEEFLDVSGEAPMRALADSLIAKMGTCGPILMYTSFERTVIMGLQKRFPDMKEGLEGLLDRLFDLHPVVRDNYYHPDMHGSWSIKAVLPVIAPDLSYKELEDVQDGLAAGRAYLEILDNETPALRKKKLENSLLEYCKLDTLAMVRVKEYLMGK